ncbi:hypothetical protein [Deinococcus roseus]|uniref:Uncharacterized protein n=1 Tax=Deinococcus roseus TaxID=392414 RepID=A0ABQ2CWT9_9DEIO|nr:hypothetical protein [Deinococcus roseus]GGJ28678.1 hypothetical protein GCM10008938_13440 [Deinococcus roseus]
MHSTNLPSVYSAPRFINQRKGQRPEACKVQVFADPDCNQVRVVFHARNHRTLRTEPHVLVNAFYREVLFRMLGPASVVQWFCCLDGHTQQTIQLAGLPGGYTQGQVAHNLNLNARSARVATG